MENVKQVVPSRVNATSSPALLKEDMAETSISDEDDRCQLFSWGQVAREAVSIGYERGAEINNLPIHWDEEFGIMDLIHKTDFKEAA